MIRNKLITVNKHQVQQHPIKRLRKPKSTSRIGAIGAIAVVIIFGVYFLVAGHAQSPYVTTEAENGTLAGGATVESSTGASGGSYVQFGSSTGSGSGNAAPGISKGMVEDIGGNGQISQDITDMQNAGVKWDRGWLNCGQASSIVSSVQAMQQHGITFLPTYNCPITTTTASYQSMLASDMSILKPYGVHTWEIGNEMDGGWTSQNNYCANNSHPGDATVMQCAESAYLVFQKAAYTTIHADDPQGALIYGGLSSYSANIQLWLNAMINDQAWQWMDGMGYHPYAGSSVTNTMSAMMLLHDSMAKNVTWASKPIWITEIGCWSTGFSSEGNQCSPGSEAAKSAYWISLLNNLKTWQTGTSFQIRTPICWYILHESSTIPGFGMVETTTPRTYLQIYNDYKNYTLP